MNTKVDKFGECTVPNPAGYEFYTKENSVVLYQTTFENPESIHPTIGDNPIYFEQSGPREKIFFNPSKVTAGIVSCGGLCPGLTYVIRGLVM